MKLVLSHRTPLGAAALAPDGRLWIVAGKEISDEVDTEELQVLWERVVNGQRVVYAMPKL
jgi:hypothetical protein